MARTKAKAKKVTKTRGKAVKRPVAKRKPTVAAKRKPAAKKRGAAAAAPARTPDASAAMRAFAKRIVAVTLADRDDEILTLYADTIESSEAGQPPAVGLDALRAKFAGWRNMTAETHFEPRRIAVDGNVVMIEWAGHVTLAATGRHVDLHEVAVHEIANGKIVREAYYYNPAVFS